MEHRIIIIYCLIEEFLKVISSKKEHKLSKISNAEVLFIGYLAVNDFNGNYKKAHCYGNDMDLVTKIEYSRFIRRIITPPSKYIKTQLAYFTLSCLKKLATLSRFLTNSFI